MYRYIFLWIVLSVAVISCYKPPYADCSVRVRNGYDKRLHIINRSSDSLTLKFEDTYPDTILNSVAGEPYFGIPEYIVFPGEDKVWLHRGCWEEYFERNQYGIIQMFVFDIRVLRSSDWSTVQAEKRYLKRYQFSLDEIKVMNWEIVYDP